MSRIYDILQRLVLLLVLGAALASCADDLLEAGPGGVVDGSMRDLAVEITFTAEDEQPLDSRAADSSLPGNSIQNINHLRVLIYDAATGALSHDLEIIRDGNPAAPDGIISNVKYDPAEDNRLPDEENDGYLDDASGKVTFNISLPSANYYMYAVANAPDLTPDQLSDRHKLKSAPRRWIASDIAQNSEMFGIFSNAPDRAATDSSPLSITNRMTTLHCWLRRLASKVTVAFDGSELYDNVQVYIDTIALFDIPQQCLLGNPNKAGRDYGSMDLEATLPIDAANRYKANTNGLIHKGQFELVQDLANIGDKQLVPDNFLHVCNESHPYLGMGSDGKDKADLDKRHDRIAKSLFFYENLQGTGNSKKQDADGDNVIDNDSPVPDDPASGWKDGKPYGTYVQVHGHYRCTSLDGNVSAGPIRYRFMLGKDTDKDFNAERNTHYKLTLMLKGYGNDADWHIEYEHKRGIVVASPQYVSYLYNKKMMATVKVTGHIDDDCFLKAEILNENEVWRPWGDGTEAFPFPAPGFTTSQPTEQRFNGPWTGFLSLRQTKVIKIEDPTMMGAPSHKYNASKAATLLQQYYKGNAVQDGAYSHNPIGVRCYTVRPNTTGYDSNATGQDGMYFVSATREGSKVTERVFSIPLFTRAKELVTWTGFTGNNPFEPYARKQRVKLSVVESDTTTLVKGFDPVYLDVIQVPRITNPKGVWRSSSNNAPFHVQLTHIDPVDHSRFRVFKSMGKWSAEVVAASAPIISLSTTKTGSGDDSKDQINVSRIEGEGEHPIDFMINFNGTSGCAVVKVRYNNYTCEHDIFCRKGYETPIDITGEGTQQWSSFNVDYFDGDKAVPTKSPLQEGSLFRRGCRTAILASNSKRYGLGVNPATVAPHTFAVKKSDKSTDELSWSNIKTTTNDGRLYDWTISNPGEHIATIGDFYTLIASTANDINFQINKAYGVLYGDGASETQMTTEMAYGYDDENGGPSAKGMRGVIICNYSTYNQIFLPLGASGYGRRKAKGGWFPSYNTPDEDGTMRYASRTALVSTSIEGTMMAQKPLFYDLCQRPGALYWAKVLLTTIPNAPGKDYQDAAKSSAFDINYFTMGFEGFLNGAVNDKTGSASAIISGSNACYLRTVFGAEK